VVVIDAGALVATEIVTELATVKSWKLKLSSKASACLV
jgi:hypothetical protein